jgi:hypothetical protein
MGGGNGLESCDPPRESPRAPAAGAPPAPAQPVPGPGASLSPGAAVHSPARRRRRPPSRSRFARYFDCQSAAPLPVKVAWRATAAFCNSGCSGRDGPFGPPPGQNPASGFPAPGFHLGSAESKALLGPGMIETRKWEWEAYVESVTLRPPPMSALASTRQRPVPHGTDAPSKLRERLVVGWHAVVPIVPIEHLAEPGVLFHDRGVTSSLGLFLELRQLGAPLLP